MRLFGVRGWVVDASMAVAVVAFLAAIYAIVDMKEQLVLLTERNADLAAATELLIDTSCPVAPGKPVVGYWNYEEDRAECSFFNGQRRGKKS